MVGGIYSYFVKRYICLHSIYINMENERGIRVPGKLRDKIRVAAFSRHMTMAEYLDSIVPEIKLVEMEK